ncbi:MAG: hypothetical protein AAB675_00985 [Patescibacteria group bacterium]
MERSDGPQYWLERFAEDSKAIDEETKQQLVKTLFVDFLELDRDDIEFFFNPDLIPNAQNPEEALRFATIGERVGMSYDSGTSGWDDSRYEERHQLFINSFREILGNIYDRKELDEITEYMGKGDESFLVMQLLGRDHFAQRRIRNAYLPMITSFVQVGGGDLTHTLFDGEGDAVDQIERLVGRPDSADY